MLVVQYIGPEQHFRENFEQCYEHAGLEKCTDLSSLGYSINARLMGGYAVEDGFADPLSRNQ